MGNGSLLDFIGNLILLLVRTDKILFESVKFNQELASINAKAKPK